MRYRYAVELTAAQQLIMETIQAKLEKNVAKSIILHYDFQSKWRSHFLESSPFNFKNVIFFLANLSEDLRKAQTKRQIRRTLVLLLTIYCLRSNNNNNNNNN